jgi:hypothetical protein
MSGRWTIAALGAALVILLVWAIAFRDDDVTRPSRGDNATRPSQDDEETRPLPDGELSLPRGEDLKPVGAGLYWVGGPRESFPFIDHAVISVGWIGLEPSDDEFSGVGWNIIDQALEAHPDYRFRLRIFAGQRAPGWVKSLDGDCVGITLPATGEQACVPRFWTDGYLDEYEELVSEIARRYDDHPQILDVVNAACMTIYAEPFIRAGFDDASNERLWAAGLNEEADRYCLERSTLDMANAFDHTRVSLATHIQWQIVNADGVEPSWEKQRELLEDLRAKLGEQLIIQNNGLGGDDGCLPGEPEMWCWLEEIPPPKGMQTEGDTKLQQDGHTIDDAVAQALELAACFVEHNQFGDDPARAEEWDQQLKSNC